MVAAVILGLYLGLFPPEPNLDPADISRELALFIAVVAVGVSARRDIPVMNLGYALLLTMLWAEVVDEFTAEPRWVGTGMPAPIGIAGLVLIYVGVRQAARKRELELSRREQAEAALRKSHSTLRAVVEENPDAVWVKDLDHRYVLVNAAFTTLIGRKREAVIGMLESDVVPADLAARAERSDARALMSGRTVQVEDTLEVDGDPRTLLISKTAFHDDRGFAVGILGVARDISERKAAEDRLVHQALHDAVTGLPNRAAFLERLDRQLARSRKEPGRTFAVLFADVDRFKEINDRHGHAAGDEVLAALARHLLHWVRPGDVVARYGGDEFTVILEDVTDIQDALLVADRVQDGLRSPLRLSTADVQVAVSVGVALASPSYVQAGDLLRDADAAMYQAKQAGGARYAVHQ